MKLTTGILAVAMMTGAAWGQNPNAVVNTGSTAKSLPQTQTKANGTGAVLVATGAVPPSAKPAPGAPAPAVKPATIPGAKPASGAAPAQAAKPASSQNNSLDRVNVVRNADDIQIEMKSREAVTPKVSKLSSPARVVVELPATAMATPQNKIAVGSAGVKGVRIGMDGKTPPTTSVVVDLEQALGYELTPGPGNSFVLTLHTQSVAKSTPAAIPAKAVAPAPKLRTVAAKPVVAAPAAPVSTAKVVKATAGTTAVAAKAAPVATTKVAASIPAAKATSPAPSKIAADEKPAGASAIGEAAKAPKPEEKKWAMTGKRDPFFSPVVQQPTGSGCSTGKKCLEIGQINLRGVVKSESGFIAVVTNTLNKAYFLHENDPVFNGYVVRITGDSVVFQETVQDKLGKPFTREVVKKIITPAV
jgi:Tfp pilus assembly protein PilP